MCHHPQNGEKQSQGPTCINERVTLTFQIAKYFYVIQSKISKNGESRANGQS